MANPSLVTPKTAFPTTVRVSIGPSSRRRLSADPLRLSPMTKISFSPRVRGSGTSLRTVSLFAGEIEPAVGFFDDRAVDGEDPGVKIDVDCLTGKRDDALDDRAGIRSGVDAVHDHDVHRLEGGARDHGEAVVRGKRRAHGRALDDGEPHREREEEGHEHGREAEHLRGVGEGAERTAACRRGLRRGIRAERRVHSEAPSKGFSKTVNEPRGQTRTRARPTTVRMSTGPSSS